METPPTPNPDADDKLLDLIADDAAELERLEEQRTAIIARRDKRIRAAADRRDGYRRRISNTRIAAAAKISDQRVGDILKTPPPSTRKETAQ